MRTKRAEERRKSSCTPSPEKQGKIQSELASPERDLPQKRKAIIIVPSVAFNPSFSEAGSTYDQNSASARGADTTDGKGVENRFRLGCSEIRTLINEIL